MDTDRIREGLTFDDVLLVPGASSVHPNEVDLASQITPRIRRLRLEDPELGGDPFRRGFQRLERKYSR